MDSKKVYSIISQNVYTGKYRQEVVVRGINLLGSGKSITKVTLAGVPSTVILQSKSNIFMYAGRGTSGLEGVICIENDLGEIISGGSWKYE